MRGHPWILALALAGIPASGGVAQEVTFGGQVRPRYEFRDTAGTGSDGFTSMRVRAHVSATLERQVKVFVQIQDVRLWGEETSTLGDFQADNFDLHQGYVEVQQSPTEALSLRARIGRQEAAFGAERLIGPVGWTQQSRSFDGVRLSAHGGFGTVDVIGFRLAEATAPSISRLTPCWPVRTLRSMGSRVARWTCTGSTTGWRERRDKIGEPSVLGWSASSRSSATESKGPTSSEN